MSDPNSIFNQDNSQVTPENQNNGGTSNSADSQNADAIANLLGSIKNERGEPKYKTLQDALVALRHSQEYIPQLTTTLKEREQELESARKEAEKIAELERTLQALTSGNNNQGGTNQEAVISEEKIAEIVSRTLTKTQQEALQKSNIETVKNAVQATYGDKAAEVFYGKARELGMTAEEFNALAARTPKAVLDLIGVKQSAAPAGGSNNVQSSINTGGMSSAQQSFVGRNKNPALVGATSQDLMSEAQAARKMVDELHASGKSVHDLTDPKVYATYFK